MNCPRLLDGMICCLTNGGSSLPIKKLLQSSLSSIMEEWRKDARKEVVITAIKALAPEEHLLRKIEKVMDYE